MSTLKEGDPVLVVVREVIWVNAGILPWWVRLWGSYLAQPTTYHCEGLTGLFQSPTLIRSAIPKAEPGLVSGLWRLCLLNDSAPA